MKSTIELKGQAVRTTLMAGNPIQTMTGLLVPPGSCLKVCAWCDRNKTLTGLLERAGHRVSHGICETCSVSMKRK